MDEDDIETTTGLSKTHLLIGGAAATILLVALVITLSRSRHGSSPASGSSVDPNLVPGDWETSIRHIGHAWDTRWQLQNDKIHDMSNRIDQLINTVVALQSAPAVVANGNAPANGAATSLPADGIVTPMAVPAPDMQAGESLPSPPGPAAVSLQP